MMLTVYDVHLQLCSSVKLAEVVKLRQHFKALSIDVIGLDGNELKLRTDELTFSIYGNVGPFMMKQMVEECTQHIFPGSIAGFSDCR